MGVMPATLTSLMSGREMLPSVRTTTVCETSGSFHTLTRMTSDSPTIYPCGTTSGVFVSAAAALGGALSAAFRFAVGACAIAASARTPATKTQQNNALTIVCFLQLNIFYSNSHRRKQVCYKTLHALAS